jgi:hypothetical protein
LIALGSNILSKLLKEFRNLSFLLSLPIFTPNSIHSNSDFFFINISLKELSLYHKHVVNVAEVNWEFSAGAGTYLQVGTLPHH